MATIQQSIKRPGIEAVKEPAARAVLTQLFDEMQKIHAQIRDDIIAGEKQVVQVAVEDLAAGADIANRPVFVSSRWKKIEITAIGILSQGAPAGIDNSNTCVFTITDDAANQIVTKTYNGSTTFPTNDYDDLGTPNKANSILLSTEHLLFTVTNGVTADTPAFLLVIEFRPG